MIGNIKVQQLMAQDASRQSRTVSKVVRTSTDQQSTDQYLASDLAVVVKAKLQEMNEQTPLQQVLQLKMLHKQGNYQIDVDTLAENILGQYSR